MTRYVALIRAVNVAGRYIAKADLKAIAVAVGLERRRTFIASGNLLFSSGKPEAELKAMLEEALGRHIAKPVGVMVRTAAEMAQVVADNPFARAPANKVAAIFLDSAPTANAVESAKGAADERLALGTREIYVHYPSGMGRSKLRIPAAASGTARNMNTVEKLAGLAKEDA